MRSVFSVLLALLLISCDRTKIDQKSSNDKPGGNEDPSAGSDDAEATPVNPGIAGIAQSQLAWDGKTPGETKSFYLVPVE